MDTITLEEIRKAVEEGRAIIWDGHRAQGVLFAKARHSNRGAGGQFAPAAQATTTTVDHGDGGVWIHGGHTLPSVLRATGGGHAVPGGAATGNGSVMNADGESNNPGG